MNPGRKYYVVVQEWQYPTETGAGLSDPLAEACTVTDDLEAAKAEAKGYAEAARATFAHDAGTDPTPVAELADRYPNEAAAFVVTAKSGLDDWWFVAKVAEMTFGIDAAGKVGT